jgi:hypothetical protein
MAALAAACAGSIIEPDERSGPGTGGPGKGEPGGGSGMSAQALCVDGSKVDVGRAPLRRITRLEYDNIVRDLLGDTSGASQGFSNDEAVGGYDANSVASVSQLQTEDYLEAAETLAATAVKDNLSKLTTCDITENSCGLAFVEAFGRKAFRRPLDQEEKDTYGQLYTTAKSQWGAPKAFELLLQAFLSSPSFLYLVEETEAPAAGETVARVTAFTLASRMSFLLWASSPDDTLLDAAESGKLDAVDGVKAEARRMLDDPRAADAVISFHEQWLGISHLEEATKDAALFPEWNDKLRDSMQQETRRFVQNVVLSGDAKLATLLESNESYIDAPLAKVYGVAAPAKAFDKVSFDAGERAGVLTQASLLAAHSGASETSWVHRGKMIREQFLCDPVTPPPPGVESNALLDPSRLTDPSCSGCHKKMDPIGTGFDAYSPIGALRFTDEKGKAVSELGEIFETDAEVDVVGSFEGPVELAQKLASSEAVGKCVAVQWFRYANRRLETAADACSIAGVQDDFAKSGGDIRELLVSITVTDAFRYRAIAE